LKKGAEAGLNLKEIGEILFRPETDIESIVEKLLRPDEIDVESFLDRFIKCDRNPTMQME